MISRRLYFLFVSLELFEFKIKVQRIELIYRCPGGCDDSSSQPHGSYDYN